MEFLDFAVPLLGATFSSTQAWTFLFVTITFMVYLYIGWASRAQESGEFYVAGQGVPAIANGAATAADWMSAASFISMAGLISGLGSDGSFYLLGWTGGYVLLAMLLAPYLRKFGQYTVPDFVAKRYYSETARGRRSDLRGVHLHHLRGGADAGGGHRLCPLPGSGDVARSDHRDGDRRCVRRAGWHEGNYLDSGGSVLRADRGVSDSDVRALLHADRQSGSSSWLRDRGTSPRR